MPSLGSRPESIIAFQDLRFYHCSYLVSCPEAFTSVPLVSWKAYQLVSLVKVKSWKVTRVRIPKKAFFYFSG